MSSLADRYRRLLVFYPAGYREDRGEEIVNTLLEGASPGRKRPTPREIVNLAVHGMRCRLGRPASRSVVVWAAITSIVCGLFAAAAATRAAWETARPLPAQAEAAAIFTSVLPGHDVGSKIYRSPAMFVIYGQPLGRDNLDTLLSFDGGEYGLGTVGTSVLGPAPSDSSQTLRVALERLRAGGWQVSAPLTRNAVECAGPPCDPAKLPTRTVVTAQRGDDILDLDLLNAAGDEETYLSVSLSRSTPWPVYPAALVAGLLGALLSWLIFGWVSRRTGSRPWQRSFSIVLFTLTMALWGLPIVFAVPFMVEHHLSETHYRWHPLWEWLGQPTFSLPLLAGLALAMLNLALAALPVPAQRRTEGMEKA
jgi:hypothetical protein